LKAAGKFNTTLVGSGGIDENGEPIFRDELPWLKDPATSYSIWAMIKDNIGKDLSRISLPVYLNDPTSILQKACQSCEYTHLLDKAAEETDAMRRIALIGIYHVTTLSICERATTKPFNPLLGETYEYKNDDFEYIAE
jgi:hypothetical protein